MSTALITVKEQMASLSPEDKKELFDTLTEEVGLVIIPEYLARQPNIILSSNGGRSFSYEVAEWTKNSAMNFSLRFSQRDITTMVRHYIKDTEGYSIETDYRGSENSYCWTRAAILDHIVKTLMENAIEKITKAKNKQTNS